MALDNADDHRVPAWNIVTCFACHADRFNQEKRIVCQRLHQKPTGFTPANLAVDQVRLEIIEVYALERLFDVKLAWLPVQSKTVPVKHAIGRVRILLDLENNDPGADAMHASAGQEHCVTRFDRQTME